jgi:hypothetical protein
MGKFKEMDLLRQEQEREAPVQEPVGDWVWSWLMDWCKRNGIAPATQDSLFEMVKDARSKFKSAPPAAQKPWVGLTDDENLDLISDAKGMGGRIRADGQLLELLKMHEAKLKEKNRG